MIQHIKHHLREAGQCDIDLREMIEERDSLRAQVAKLTQERDQWKADCADRTSLLVDAQKQADLHWDTSAEEEVEL